MKQELLELLEPHGQQHVLAFWDQLSAPEQQVLAQQIRQVDLPLINQLYTKQGSEIDWAALARRAEPPPAFRLNDKNNRFTPEEARRRGEQALKAGEVGVVLVAGGQGTRLGFNSPKGMFSIGPVSGASLFQILIEKLQAVARRAGRSIPLYLMTSPATHEPTVQYLAQQQRFGLPENDLKIFSQGTMPAVEMNSGRLLLAKKGELFRSPDGHGGMLAALVRSGSLADCRARGIRHLFYLQVDNPLTSMCDAEFIGYHLLSESEVSSQVIAKQTPLDKVGNFALIDGQVRIIEYSDLPADVGEQRNSDGSLKFWAGSIAVHVLDLDFLDRMSRDSDALPFHAAKKKVPYVDGSGNLVEPDQINAIKFERFIFDLIPNAKNAIAVEVDEQLVFAPVKNASGERRDTPETVKAQMIHLHTGWLRAAGATVAEGVPVEICPLFALDAGEVAAKVQPGQRIDSPTYLR